jgi:predicted nucleic acid-binding protein
VIAVDANILIYVFEGNQEFGKTSLQLLKTIEQTKLNGLTSELAYAEICSFPEMSDKNAEQAKHFIEQVDLEIYEITKDILINSATIRRKKGIKLPDAIYLATAISAGATHFVTNDKSLLSKKVEGLSIVPLLEWQSNLKKIIKF